MDLQALRERTRAEHEGTEAVMPLMSAGLTRGTYVATLQAMVPVLLGWEAWAEAHCPERLLRLLEGRQRSRLLLQDLAALQDVTQQPLQVRGEDLPAISFDGLFDDVAGDVEDGGAGREACFLGGLYVVEGSTLGGQFIARHVEATLGLATGQGNAYFLGYGDQTSARWREVKGALSEAPEEWIEATVGAARRTFGIFGEALRAAEPILMAAGVDD